MTISAVAHPSKAVTKIGTRRRSSRISPIGSLNHSVCFIVPLALHTNDRVSVGGSLGNGSKGAPPNADKVPEIELETDYDGYPLLPSWEDVKIWKLPLKKTLISKFMGGMYGMSTSSFYYFSVLFTLQNSQPVAETRKSHGASYKTRRRTLST